MFVNGRLGFVLLGLVTFGMSNEKLEPPLRLPELKLNYALMVLPLMRQLIPLRLVPAVHDGLVGGSMSLGKANSK